MKLPDDDYNFVTTTKDIAVAAIDLIKWGIACGTIIWVLAYWTPRAARWLDKSCTITAEGCE